MPDIEEEARRNWTREELILAFNLYCKIPFGSIHNRNPKIIELAQLVNRSPSSVSWKLANFASLDPVLQARGIKGGSHGSKGDEEIWNEFHQNWEGLAIESETLRASRTGKSLESIVTEDKDELASIPEMDYSGKAGFEKERIIKARINQNFFRKAVLTNYDSRCAITGISEPTLLVASHITPWAIDEKNRINPHNGICLNALHDKAFDRGLISLDQDCKIIISGKLRSRLKSETASKAGDIEIGNYFLRYENQPIHMPKKFFPGREFLDYHREKVFLG